MNVSIKLNRAEVLKIIERHVRENIGDNNIRANIDIGLKIAYNGKEYIDSARAGSDAPFFMGVEIELYKGVL
jgi:hypothetical protein